MLFREQMRRPQLRVSAHGCVCARLGWEAAAAVCYCSGNDWTDGPLTAHLLEKLQSATVLTCFLDALTERRVGRHSVSKNRSVVPLAWETSYSFLHSGFSPIRSHLLSSILKFVELLMITLLFLSFPWIYSLCVFFFFIHWMLDRRWNKQLCPHFHLIRKVTVWCFWCRKVIGFFS